MDFSNRPCYHHQCISFSSSHFLFFFHDFLSFPKFYKSGKPHTTNHIMIICTTNSDTCMRSSYSSTFQKMGELLPALRRDTFPVLQSYNGRTTSSAPRWRHMQAIELLLDFSKMGEYFLRFGETHSPVVQSYNGQN